MSARRGIVSVDGERVGVIAELEGGGTRFTYDGAWLARPDAVPVSLTLPLRTEPYTDRGARSLDESDLDQCPYVSVDVLDVTLDATGEFADG